jgi:predicted alpha/beta superfamily hydrolase
MTASATLSRTSAHRLSSRHVGRDFLITIAEPALPHNGSPLPAIYVLDGSVLFGMATDVARMMQAEGSAPAAYVVGIGYPTEDFVEQMTVRIEDMVHPTLAELTDEVRTQLPPDLRIGGGAAFGRFIEEELIPFVTATVAVDQTRSVLFGDSLGGLFTARTLKRSPDLFGGWIMISPSVWFDRAGVLDGLERIAPTGLKPRVFIGVGSLEDGDMKIPAEVLHATLNGSGQVSSTHHVFEGESHGSVPAPGFARGLRVVFSS